LAYNTLVQVITYSPQDPTSHQAVLQRAQQVIASGGLVIFPTETVYGAGVDATNPAAVEKLLAYKSRRQGKPLSIAVTDSKMAERYVELNDQARELYRRFLPGPVTVVSRAKGTVAPGVASEFGTLGVRIPAYPLITDLVAALGKPLTATSANASGEARPYTIDTILEPLSGKQRDLIDLIIDAGTLPPNLPSTVIDTTLSTPITLRAGDIQAADSPEKQLSFSTTSEEETQQLAGRLLLKNWDTIVSKGLLVTLDGSLGVGKTIFAKGIAKFLQIEQTITSPTYTYISEYPYQRHGVTGTFFHLDVWKIDQAAQFELLEFPKLLQPGNVIAVEWWHQVKEFAPTVYRDFPQLNILIEDKDDQRVLSIYEPK
jgi:L-threonylcarbamoyladenylate synthase